MRKLIFSLSMLVNSPSGLGTVVLAGIALFAMVNTMLPPEYFADVAIIGALIMIVAMFAAICEIDNSCDGAASKYSNLPDMDDDIASKTRDITSKWYSTDTEII